MQRPRVGVRVRGTSDAALPDGAIDRLPDVRRHCVGNLDSPGRDLVAVVGPPNAADAMGAAILLQAKMSVCGNALLCTCSNLYPRNDDGVLANVLKLVIAFAEVRLNCICVLIFLVYFPITGKAAIRWLSQYSAFAFCTQSGKRKIILCNAESCLGALPSVLGGGGARGAALPAGPPRKDDDSACVGPTRILTSSAMIFSSLSSVRSMRPLPVSSAPMVSADGRKQDGGGATLPHTTPRATAVVWLRPPFLSRGFVNRKLRGLREVTNLRDAPKALEVLARDLSQNGCGLCAPSICKLAILRQKWVRTPTTKIAAIARLLFWAQG